MAVEIPGVRGYYTKTPGVSGEIKQSPEDFLVEEILPDETVISLGSKHEPSGRGKHTIVVLEKRNWDTIVFAKKLARLLGVGQKSVGYAGTKDKRAVTVQRMSVYDTPWEKISKLDIKDASFSLLGYSDKRVGLGDLWGNRFTVKITNIAIPEKEAKKRISATFRELKKGFPAWFGEQRFGSTRPVTHLVGKQLVLGKPRKAVETYLWKTFPGERRETREARERLSENKDYGEALGFFPKSLIHERTLLEHLKQKPKDHLGALLKLPKRLVSMFLHAYQSFLFNKVISARLEEGLGLEAVPGDIVFMGGATAPIYGHSVRIAKNKPGRIEKRVLEEEKLSLDDFRNAKNPGFSLRGFRKKIKTVPKNLVLSSPGKKEATVSFSLEKGKYATVLLREVTKS